MDDGWEADGELGPGDAWAFVDAYFEERGLVRQQLDSYNDFVGRGIQAIVAEEPTIEVRPRPQFAAGRAAEPTPHRLRLGRVRISKPRATESDGSVHDLLPMEARLRNLTYAGKLTVDVTVEPEGGEPTSLPDVFVGLVPTMLRSAFCHLAATPPDQLSALDECPLDVGGYFLVGGAEKVLVAQERLADNTVLVFHAAGTRAAGKRAHTHVAELRSRPTAVGRPPTPVYVKLYPDADSPGDCLVRVKLAGVGEEIPLVILFRALGVTRDREIAEHVAYDLGDEELVDVLAGSIRRGARWDVYEEERALDWIGRRTATAGTARAGRVAHARALLQRDFLPHVGVGPGDAPAKALHLGYVVHRLLLVRLDRRPPDDRDHFANKRVDLAGPLLASVFRGLWRKLRHNLGARAQALLERGARDLPVRELFDACGQHLSGGLRYSLSTGNWSSDRANVTKSGVSQSLSRLTFACTLSNLRRINTPVQRDGKVVKPRQLHNTGWGYVCPAETPEGHACGLIKNMALMGYVSTDGPADQAEAELWAGGTLPPGEFRLADVPAAVRVFLNGRWLGCHAGDTLGLARRLRERRRRDARWETVSVAYEIQERELHVWTDEGRVCRPLLVVGPDQRVAARAGHAADVRAWLGQPATRAHAWTAGVLAAGLVEHVDAAEEETALIALEPGACRPGETYTHAEVHPSMILGVAASIIPFPEHNQSPRNTYQAAMGKQAMGVYVTNYPLRMDTTAHVLYYPQRPLVTTRPMEHLRFRDLPAGQNAIVAVSCYTGYNQEDSVIMNQSAIDRGLFRSTTYQAYTEVEDRTSQQAFARPDRRDTAGMRWANYAKLDEDGLVPPGTPVSAGDILVGKVVPAGPAGGERSGRPARRDASMAVRTGGDGRVDRVLLTKDAEGRRLAKVRVRSVRAPQIGDKFSSRHGQKGTVGMTYRQEDMPFTAEGISPDLIINPHAIPRRMTIGQLVETQLGKVCAVSGTEGDATAFAGASVDAITAMLQRLGYQRHGNEVLHNGRTGRQMDAQLFIGPTYYQRLKHLVDDKIHGRSRGQRQALTRQPMEGRTQDGGLRFGEMERDCMISHGASQFLKERLLDDSDLFERTVCRACGLPALRGQCTACGGDEVATVRIPYVAHLLLSELTAMSIAPRLHTT